MERNLTLAIKIIGKKTVVVGILIISFFCEDFLLTKKLVCERAESSRKNSRINVRTAHSAGLLQVGHLPFLGVGSGWI